MYKTYLETFNLVVNNVTFKWGGKRHTLEKFFENLIKRTESLSATKNQIFFYGNGASFAFSDHMALDWSKNGKINSHCLSSNSLLTALGNDYSYNEIFSRHLEIYSKPGDLVVTISSSGNSPNIKDVIEFCKKRNIELISLSGLKNINFSFINSENAIYVPAKTYGIVECAHQLFLHMWLDLFMKVYEWEKIDYQNMNFKGFKL